VLVVGFGSGPLQANCYLLAEAAGGPCVVVDPGEDVTAPLTSEGPLRRPRQSRQVGAA